jgi:hypothetical protein
MNKLIELYHDHKKRDFNIMIFYLEEEKKEDMLALVKEEPKIKYKLNYLVSLKKIC